MITELAKQASLRNEAVTLALYSPSIANIFSTTGSSNVTQVLFELNTQVYGATWDVAVTLASKFTVIIYIVVIEAVNVVQSSCTEIASMVKLQVSIVMPEHTSFTKQWLSKSKQLVSSSLCVLYILKNVS